MNKKLKNKIKNYSKLFRIRGPQVSRFPYLRLDKNEKVSKFNTIFLNKIIKNIKSEHLSAYPEVENLYKLISKKNKVNKKSIVLTAGSDGAIRACFEFFVEKDSRIITLQPTFAMVDIYSKIFQAKQIKISYDKNLNIDFKKIIKSINKNIDLIVLANPNSPTGTIIELKEMKKILDKAKKFNVAVLVDEAYYGFCETSCVSLIKNYPNLIISRTFSKAYGAAGIRVGYIITNSNTANFLFKLKPMYEVNSLGVLISEMAIKHRVDKEYISEEKSGKKLLKDYLQSNNYDFIDTHANFIHINFGKKVKKAISFFSKDSILVKGGPQVKGYENYLRITTGPQREMSRVIKILKKLL